MYKVSVWSSFFSDESPEEAVKIMSAHKYKYTEFSDEHGAVLLQRGNPASEGKKLLDYAKSLGMSFPQGHLLLAADIVQPDALLRRQTVDSLKKWIDLFEALEIKSAVLHPGGENAIKSGWTKEQADAVRSESLSILAVHTKGTHVRICLENIRHDLNSFFEMFENTGVEGLGICLDTGHLNLCGGGWGEFIRRAGSRLKALHIADNLGSKDDHMLPYGTGTVNWSEVMSGLKEISYNDLFNYEIPGERRCPKAVREVKLDYGLKLAALMSE